MVWDTVCYEVFLRKLGPGGLQELVFFHFYIYLYPLLLFEEKKEIKKIYARQVKQEQILPKNSAKNTQRTVTSLVEEFVH